MAAAFDTFFKAKEVTVRKAEIISDQITQGPFFGSEEKDFIACSLRVRKGSE